MSDDSDERDDDRKITARRARSQWGDDERAAVGRGHREADAETGASTASERRRAALRARRVLSRPRGVPVIADPIERELGPVPEDLGGREITEPWEILDRDELTPDEARIVARSKRDSNDPLTFADGAKIMSRLIRKELDHRSEEKRRADELLAVVDSTPSGKLAARVGELEKRSKTWTKIVWLVAIAIGGGLFEAATRLWDRSAHETEIAFRLRAAEDLIKQRDDKIFAAEKVIVRLEEKIDRLERFLEQPDRRQTSPHHSSKDNQP